MNNRPSLGFKEDETPVEKKPQVVSLDDFKPTPVKKLDKEQVAEAAQKASFKSRESKPASIAEPKPVRKDRRHRTGRSAQFNIKLRPETIEAFCAVADAQGWVLGEAFEKAVELLEKEYQEKALDPK